MFSSFFFVSWKNRQKLIMVCSPFEEIIRFLSLDVLVAFRIRENVFGLNFTGAANEKILAKYLKCHFVLS